MSSHDFILIFSIKSCGSVNWVCLAHDGISEHGVDFSHYILQKKISLLWIFICISDSVSCNAVNLYTAAIIILYPFSVHVVTFTFHYHLMHLLIKKLSQFTFKTTHVSA